MSYVLLMIAAQLALANLGNVTVNQTEWEYFKLDHGKNYDGPMEDSARGLIFAQNKLRVELLNNKLSSGASFTVGLNHLADLSDYELKARNGFKLLPGRLQSNGAHANKFLEDIFNDNTTEVPDSIDWRKVPGRVSAVKNQGLKCGSCWAFATTGVLEGQEKVRNVSDLYKVTSKVVELSEQNLLDCDQAEFACEGGNPVNALAYVRDVGGIDDEKSYPYLGYKDQCRFNNSRAVLTDAGAAILPANNEEKLKEVLAKFGPVAVAINASQKSFIYYQSGVYYDEACMSSADSLDHAVLVVGYGTDPEHGDYWIVKNSWDTVWGESGYIRMARNKGNNCGIATMPMIPTF